MQLFRRCVIASRVSAKQSIFSSMQPRKIFIDSFSLFVEFIKDFANRNPNLKYNFLNPVNINNIERESKKYQNMSYFWLKPHMTMLEKAKLDTPNSRSITDLSSQVKGISISTTFSVYKNYVDQLNNTKDNIFTALLDVYPQHHTRIENIHKTWEIRSHFALVPSDQFEVVISILNNFSDYITLIMEDLDKNYFTDLSRMINALKHFIRDQKELLSTAMLSRLKLAKNNQVDDVVLITFEELEKVGLDKKYGNLIRDNMTRHMLAPELCFSFHNFIQNNGSKNEKNELYKLYNSFNHIPHNIPIISDEHISQNTKKISNICWKNVRLCSITKVGAQFSNCYFTDSDFFSSDFRLAVFKNSYFRTTDLTNANFEGASFPDCDFQWSHGAKTIFNSTDLRNTSFQGTNFYAGQFQNAILNHTNFRLAQLNYANFDYAAGSGYFDGADLCDASFVGTDLSAMSFNNASLERVKFFDVLTIHNIKKTLISFSKQIENHKNKNSLCTAAIKDIISQVMMVKNPDDAINMIEMTTKYLIASDSFMPSYLTNTISSFSIFSSSQETILLNKQSDSLLLKTAKDNIIKKLNTLRESKRLT